MKKAFTPNIHIHPWKGKDAGETAARDWTIIFILFLVGLFVALLVQVLDFYYLLSGKVPVVSDATQEALAPQDEINEAYGIYQDKVRQFEIHTGLRL